MTARILLILEKTRGHRPRLQKTPSILEIEARSVRDRFLCLVLQLQQNGRSFGLGG